LVGSFGGGRLTGDYTLLVKWCYIPISLIAPENGEQKAQPCA